MELSPEEQDIFAAIVLDLEAELRARIPWDAVARCVSVVAAGTVLAVLLGVPAGAVVAFAVTFVVALGGGLMAMGRGSARRHRAG